MQCVSVNQRIPKPQTEESPYKSSTVYIPADRQRTYRRNMAVKRDILL